MKTSLIWLTLLIAANVVNAQDATNALPEPNQPFYASAGVATDEPDALLKRPWDGVRVEQAAQTQNALHAAKRAALNNLLAGLRSYEQGRVRAAQFHLQLAAQSPWAQRLADAHLMQGLDKWHAGGSGIFVVDDLN